MTTSEEWQHVKSVSNAGILREYITHIVEPRFTGRLVQVDSSEGQPIETEGEADLESGFVFRVGGRTILCEIDWRDRLPEHADADEFAAHWVREAVKAWHSLKGNFLTWRALPPVREMAKKVGLDIGHCQTWIDYATLFRTQNDSEDGALVNTIRHLVGDVEAGEAAVLFAMLNAAGYTKIADQIGGNEIWSLFDLTYGQCSQAVGIAIMRN